MSFAFMPFYTGDYFRDTKHLTPEEHGIFILLLCHCWDQKGPVPLDERRQCGIVNARSGGEIESLRRVLGEFFVKLEDGWYNKRMAEEVARAEKISHQNAEAGRRSAEVRSMVRQATRVQRPLNAGSTPVGTPTPTPTTTPTTTTTPYPPSGDKTKARAKPAPSPSGLPEWLDAKDWAAYLDHCRGLRKPKTAEAQRRALLELDKLRQAGNPPAAVIEQSLVRGWIGLFPVRNNGVGASRQDLLEARNSRAAQEWLQQDSRSDEGVIDHASERQG